MDVFAALADPVRRDLLVRLAVAADPRRRPRSGSPDQPPGRQPAPAGADRRGAGHSGGPRPERLYALRGEGLAPVHGLLRALAVAQPRVGPDALDALDLEVRRTVRDHRSPSPTQQTSWRRSDDHDSDRPLGGARRDDVPRPRPHVRRPIESVWAAVTEPERLARWIGTWTGDPASGQVDFRMLFEGQSDDQARRASGCASTRASRRGTSPSPRRCPGRPMPPPRGRWCSTSLRSTGSPL